MSQFLNTSSQKINQQKNLLIEGEEKRQNKRSHIKIIVNLLTLKANFSFSLVLEIKGGGPTSERFSFGWLEMLTNRSAVPKVYVPEAAFPFQLPLTGVFNQAQLHKSTRYGMVIWFEEAPKLSFLDWWVGLPTPYPERAAGVGEGGQ